MVSRIEQLINEIEEFIDSCKYQPLSNTKILVNKEELEELLVELRLRIPDEIKKYQKIISNQDAILNQARSQADAMLQEANAQTNELVNEHEIMQIAYSHANEVVEQANLRPRLSWTTRLTMPTASAREPSNIRMICSAACRPSLPILWRVPGDALMPLCLRCSPAMTLFLPTATSWPEGLWHPQSSL